MTVLYSPIFLPWFVHISYLVAAMLIWVPYLDCRFIFQFGFPLGQELGNVSISRGTASGSRMHLPGWESGPRTFGHRERASHIGCQAFRNRSGIPRKWPYNPKCVCRAKSFTSTHRHMAMPNQTGKHTQKTPYWVFIPNTKGSECGFTLLLIPNSTVEKQSTTLNTLWFQEVLSLSALPSLKIQVVNPNTRLVSWTEWTAEQSPPGLLSQGFAKQMWSGWRPTPASGHVGQVWCLDWSSNSHFEETSALAHACWALWPLRMLLTLSYWFCISLYH